MALIQLSNTWTNIATLLSNTILTVISNILLSSCPFPHQSPLHLQFFCLSWARFHKEPLQAMHSLGVKRHMAFDFEPWLKLLPTLPKVLMKLSSVCVSLSSVVGLICKSIDTKAIFWAMHSLSSKFQATAALNVCQPKKACTCIWKMNAGQGSEVDPGQWEEVRQSYSCLCMVHSNAWKAFWLCKIWEIGFQLTKQVSVCVYIYVYKYLKWCSPRVCIYICLQIFKVMFSNICKNKPWSCHRLFVNAKKNRTSSQQM